MPTYIVKATPLKCVQKNEVCLIQPGDPVELSEDEAKKIGKNVVPKSLWRREKEEEPTEEKKKEK